MVGIYSIKNNITKDIYIGSSSKIKPRWNLHKCDLRKNRHHSIILQRAWNKYGEDSFTFNIVEICTEDNLIKIEQKYLDLLKPKYNINEIAENCTGREVSKETRLKISKANKGNTHSEKTKKKMSEYRKNNPLVFTDEIKEKISKSKLGKNNPMFGKKTSKKQKEAVKKALTGKSRSKEVKEKISKANSIPIVQLDLNNNFIKEWQSTLEVERTLKGFLGNGVTRCCKKTRKTYKGFIWVYKKEYEKL